MVHMKTAKCPTCGGMVFKLAGKASKLCHDECLNCRSAREEEQQRQTEEAERRHLENEEMDRHFQKHPHG